jgi:hypothetical protein
VLFTAGTHSQDTSGLRVLVDGPTPSATLAVYALITNAKTWSAQGALQRTQDRQGANTIQGAWSDEGNSTRPA